MALPPSAEPLLPARSRSLPSLAANQPNATAGSTYRHVHQLTADLLLLRPVDIWSDKNVGETAALTAMNREYGGWSNPGEGITQQKELPPKLAPLAAICLLGLAAQIGQGSIKALPARATGGWC